MLSRGQSREAIGRSAHVHRFRRAIAKFLSFKTIKCTATEPWPGSLFQALAGVVRPRNESRDEVEGELIMYRRTDVADRPAVLYGVEEAAAALRLSRSVLYELIRSGQLRTVKQGVRRLVRCQRWLSTCQFGVRCRMSTRRSRGDGGLQWDQRRKRWVATATVGYEGRGNGSCGTATVEPRPRAKAKLRDLLRSREDGVVLTRDGYTVRQAVRTGLSTA